MGVGGRDDDRDDASDDDGLAEAAATVRERARACVEAASTAIERARAMAARRARRRDDALRRADALERERDALRAECEALRERLGREIVARGALEDGLDAPETEALRGECELYREATRKYRKRAEHYEALYRAARGGGGGRTAVRIARRARARRCVRARSSAREAKRKR